MNKLIPAQLLLNLIKEWDKEGDIGIYSRGSDLYTLVEKYEVDRPCYYKLECLRNGRCPFDPVCNN